MIKDAEKHQRDGLYISHTTPGYCLVHIWVEVSSV